MRAYSLRPKRALLATVIWSLFSAVIASGVSAGCGKDSSPANANESDASTNADGNPQATSDGSSNDGNASDANATKSDGSITDEDAGDSAAPLCPTGATLLHDRRACSATPVAPPASFANVTANAGDVVSMGGLDEGAIPCLPAVVCQESEAATMLFSDDPESPTTDGVLYADTVGPGHFRIYVYHANGGTNARKFPVVVLNQNATAAHVTITKKGLTTPSANYVAIGKTVAAAWLDSTLTDVVTVPASTRVLLDSDLDAESANQNELVHAIYDVTTDAAVKISVVSLLPNEDATTATAGLSLLADDTLHSRGTYPGADLLLIANAGGEGASARHLRLGDGTTESELTGTDATTGKPAKALAGNYGVFYTFQIAASSMTALSASPRGGAWGGVAKVGAAASTQLPSASQSLADTTSAIWIADYASSALSASLVSAGGSNLPVDLVVLSR